MQSDCDLAAEASVTFGTLVFLASLRREDKYNIVDDFAEGIGLAEPLLFCFCDFSHVDVV